MAADSRRPCVGGAVHGHQCRLHELCRSHGGQCAADTTNPAAVVLGSDDRQPHPGVAAHRHQPWRQHLDQCPASLHRDHCRASHSSRALKPLDGTTFGLEGMAPAANDSGLKAIQLIIAISKKQVRNRSTAQAKGIRAERHEASFPKRTS